MTGTADENDDESDSAIPLPTPWKTFLAEATQRFRAAGFENPENEARRIVETASGYDAGSLSSGLTQLATERGVHHFDEMMRRRLEKEPVCGVFQLALVKVRGVLTVASPVSLEVTVRTTFDAG